MATCNSIQNVFAGEKEPEDKADVQMAVTDFEQVMEFYFEAFREYFVEHMQWMDVMFYKHFDMSKRKEYRELHKSGSYPQKLLVGKMLDDIASLNVSDKYSAFYDLLDETDNSKLKEILSGKSIPNNNKQKNLIDNHFSHICGNLHFNDIKVYLGEYKLVNTRELQSLHEASQRCEIDAKFEMIMLLPNRHPNWFTAFLAVLVRGEHEALASRIDKTLAHELKDHKKAVEKRGLEWDVGQFEEFMSNRTDNMSSLMPVDGQLMSPANHSQARAVQMLRVQPSETDPSEPRMQYLSIGRTIERKVERELKEEIPGTSYNNMKELYTSYASGEPSENNLSPYKDPSSANRDEEELTSIQSAMSDLSFSSLRQIQDNVSEFGDTTGGEDSGGYGREDYMLSSYIESPDSTQSIPKFDLEEAAGTDSQYEENKTFDESQTDRKLLYERPKGRNEDNGVRPKVYHTENSLNNLEKTLRDKAVFIGPVNNGASQQLNIMEEESQSTPPEADNNNAADDDIELRDYQVELAAGAMKGKNVIIVAPTGSGKTRVAFRIIQEHMRRMKGHGIAKVIFLVNQVALAQQQGAECQKMLKQYKIHTITGDSQRSKSEYLKDFIDKRDILVVTAQVLLDALVRNEINGISQFSLIIFDECHHTHANHIFNKIMSHYMELKMEGDEDKLPQIVGLTASVGVGKSRNEEKAVEHIKCLMANLDAQDIATVRKHHASLRQYVSVPEEETHKVSRRENDKFGETLHKIMKAIEQRMREQASVMEMPEAKTFEPHLRAPAEKGNAQYTQWVCKLLREIAKLKSPQVREFLNPCRTHLEYYNNALIIYNDTRFQDALEYLQRVMKEWKEHARMDTIETKLYQGYEKIKNHRFSQCANPKLMKLQELIIKAYGTGEKRENSRGIVFVKTRDLAKALVRWMKETLGLRELNPIEFLGQSANADSGGMTKFEQEDALKYFRDGKHKLIVATSVAEEGLDISKCNLVIRYDHVTNEIAMVQSRGRGRAADSKYYVIAEESNGMAEKEELNGIRESMMRKAIIKVQESIATNPAKFHREIYELQDKASVENKMSALGRKRQVRKAGQFTLHCFKCDNFICVSEDIKKIEMAHHVIIDDTLDQRVDFIDGQSNPSQQGNQICGKIICKQCGRNLGVIIIYRGCNFYAPKIDNFIIKDINGRQDTCSQWKKVPFNVVSLETADLRRIVKSQS